ncbi:alpha/beta hydrolase [Variovorax sp. UC122_21]|uniref:alpha/beta hydrolase n=1 Tax=Variovorax sp. UC122_21 TaxID=3374554 RepID=UPI003756C027
MPSRIRENKQDAPRIRTTRRFSMQLHRMFRRFTWALAAAFVLGLAACGGGGGGGGGGGLPLLPPASNDPPPAPPPSSTSRVINATLKSNANGDTYPIQIYLPAAYDGGSASYPAMYLTDGDASFNLGVSRFKNFVDILERQGKKAIVVGIGGTAHRNTDYLPPGSTAYHTFVTRELVPYVESNYRANPARRMLSGLSNGGIFVASAFFMEGSGQFTFQYFFSSEAPFNGPVAAQVDQLEKQMYADAATRDVPVTLLLAYALNNTGGPTITAMHDKIASRNYKGLKLSLKGYAGGHTQMDLPSLEDIAARFIE